MRKRTLPPPRTVARSQSALRIEVLHPGEGPSPARGDLVQIHFTCLLAATNGCVDTSRAKGRREPMEITIGARQVVAGMEEGLQALALGAVARLHVPPHLGYGGVAAGPVPAESARADGCHRMQAFPEVPGRGCLLGLCRNSLWGCLLKPLGCL